MKYVIPPFLLLMSVYPMSYAGYVWKKKNRFGAVGVVLIAAASVVLPAVLLFTR